MIFCQNAGWVRQTDALVGLRSRRPGLRSPTNSPRDLDPPYGEKRGFVLFTIRNSRDLRMHEPLVVGVSHPDEFRV